MVSFVKHLLSSNASVGDCVRVLNQYASNLADIFASAAQDPQVGGVLLRGVSLKSGSNQVAHTLGKTLTGWELTRVRASATVYDTQDTQPLPSTYLTLVASAPVVVDILVF